MCTVLYINYNSVKLRFEKLVILIILGSLISAIKYSYVYILPSHNPLWLMLLSIMTPNTPSISSSPQKLEKPTHFLVFLYMNISSEKTTHLSLSEKKPFKTLTGVH